MPSLPIMACVKSNPYTEVTPCTIVQYMWLYFSCMKEDFIISQSEQSFVKCSRKTCSIVWHWQCDVLPLTCLCKFETKNYFFIAKSYHCHLIKTEGNIEKIYVRDVTRRLRFTWFSYKTALKLPCKQRINTTKYASQH